MMILLLLSLITSITIGYISVSSLMPNHELRYSLNLVNLCLAVGMGFGISSCIYFIWLLTVGKTNYVFIFAENLTLSTVLVYHLWTRKHVKPILSLNEDCYTLKIPIISRILSVGFYCAMVLTFVIFLLMSRILPHGGWDAWQTWNLFARFIYRGGVHWKEAFTPLLAPHHPDYPLLIPSLVARSWQYMGAESQLAPILIAFSFCLATILLLFSTISIIKGKNHGYLAGIILMGTIGYVVLGAYQYADVPLGFYFLATLSLVALQDIIPDNSGISLLAGITAGLSCWTKNEGFLFLLAVITARLVLILMRSNKKAILIQLCYLAAGASVVLVVVLYFKYEIAPVIDLFIRQNTTRLLFKVTDPSRYMVVLKAFFMITFDTNPLFFLVAFYPLYSGIAIDEKMKESILTILIVMLIMYTGYFAFYVITPYDLEWHLDTSLSRLLMQLWPSLIFMTFLVTRRPEKSTFI